MEYPNVKRSHIVPAMYLRGFADDDAIAVHILGQQGVKLMHPENVGTRRRFYRRHRPADGEPIDDIEWSLGKAEGRAAPLLADLRARWPLPPADKAGLGEFIGLQLIRGPRFRVWWEQSTLTWLDEQRMETKDEAKLESLEKWLMSDTNRLTHMLQMARKMATVFGSMHWTLVEFASPLLATSDHPVVLWPLSASGRAPAPTPHSIGVFETLEIRYPVSPRLLLLLTWNDLPDAEEPLRGSRHHAANANAFTVAEADRQWFHVPGTSPPCGAGRFLPLSAELVPGYDIVSATNSLRRARASDIVKALIGSSDFPEDFEIVTVQAGGG